MNFEGQKNKTIKVFVEQVRQGTYVTYVFKDLNAKDGDFHRYIMCTECPNWTGIQPEFGQEGFLTYTSVIAGVDKWYNKTDGQYYDYRYTANYYLDFVPVTHVILGGRVTPKDELIVT